MDVRDVDFCSLPHKEMCDLLSTLEDKDNRKRSAAQIKRLDTQKVLVVDVGSDATTKVPHKKKTRTGVFPSHNQKNKSKTPNYGGINHYLML